jgi:hypothetical protein
MRQSFVFIALVTALFGGCLPYTIGSTAQTVPAGETVRTGVAYIIPNAIGLDGEHESLLRGIDVELRRGLDDRSDIGLRVPASSGLVFTYKRRLAGSSAPESAALAVMVGGGLVNMAEHAEGELTLLASGRADGLVTSYGGVRVMAVHPLSSLAVYDEPTAGGFFGLRLRFADLDVSPELGLYYDRSALEIRRRNYIVVPGISLTPRGARAR